MKNQAAVGGFILTLVLFSGCSLFNFLQYEKNYPKYDTVLTYDRPFDVTFLRTLEAVNTVPGWVLEETDKEKGLIVLHNRQYSHIFDKDKGVARILVKRISRKQTSVELDKPTQLLQEGGKFLESIDQIMIATAPQQGVSS